MDTRDGLAVCTPPGQADRAGVAAPLLVAPARSGPCKQGAIMSRKSERRAPSLGEAIRWLLGGIPSDSLAPTRFYLEAYHGKELDFTDPFLLDLLNVEFGLTRAQAGTLTPPQLGFLLRHKHHLKGQVPQHPERFTSRQS